ncbi:hypothetical protein BH24DEI2_BH24DEI2_09810 [soil metagenome]
MKRVTLLLFVLLTAATAQTPTSFELPGDAVFPEGVAYDAAAGVLYVGSTTDGTLYRGDVATGEVTVFAQGTQPTAIGMKTDDNGRLWVAGGNSGNVYVYDTTSGELLKTFETPAADATFLNDVTVLPDGSVYVTDSQRPVIFKISATPDDLGELESWLELDGTAIEYVEGFNLNGIASSADGQFLVTVQSNTGKLFRVDVAAKEVAEITVGTELTAGDGILLDGDTLYVARNSFGEIAVIAMTPDLSEGTVTNTLTDDDLTYPTTIAKVDSSLLVVNSQFNNRGEGKAPVLPFTVSRIDLP